MCRPFREAWFWEACAHRLAPGTNWVAHWKDFPVRASLYPWTSDAQGRRSSHSVGVAITLGQVAPFSLVEPDFPCFTGSCADGCSGDKAMVAQLRRAPITSPPEPAFGTGTTVVSPQLPSTLQSALQWDNLPLFRRSTRPDPVLRQALGPSGDGIRSHRHHFPSRRRPQGPLRYLGEKWQPPPGEPGEAPSTMVAPETFGVSVYSKTALKGPAKVGSAGERGFTCAPPGTAVNQHYTC